MGLFGDMVKGRRMKDPVRGQAQVVSSTMWSGGSWANCRMQLVVQGDGVPPTPVELDCMARADRWPMPGMTLPVTVDRADPERVKVEWDDVESAKDRSARNAEAIAAAMRSQQMPAVPQHPVAPPAADPEDERLARLAKLGALRDQGVLTEQEFEDQKRRILGS